MKNTFEVGFKFKHTDSDEKRMVISDHGKFATLDLNSGEVATDWWSDILELEKVYDLSYIKPLNKLDFLEKFCNIFST